MNEFIQQNQGAIMVFFFVLAVLCLMAAAFFAVLMRRTEKKADQRLKQARADITDMTILFQTMRDIIGQQKALAREFNEELEHKMEQVKHILNQGMEKNRHLLEKQQRIAMELEEARAEIDGLFRQVSHLQKIPGANSGGEAPRKSAPPRPVNRTTPRTAPARPTPPVPPAPVAAAPPTPPKPPAPPVSTPEPVAPRTAPAATDPRDSAALPRELVRPSRPAAEARERGAAGMTPEEEVRLAETGVTRAPFTSWIAEDLLARDKAPRKPEAPRPATPDPAEKGPTNGDAAREAFRALLNMPTAPEPEPAPLDVLPHGDGAAEAPESPGGAIDMSIPLQQRVLEYSEAGMTVAQVSRELGIGKGEVRLMLSLAKQQSPKQE